jgi:hypothetical protein
VVGLDGSQVSETALRMGAELARRLGLPLHLVRVADLAVVHWGANQASAAYAELSGEMVREKGKATHYLETVAQPLRDEGLNLTTEVRSGLAARELADAAGPGGLARSARPAASAPRQRRRRGGGALARVGADREGAQGGIEDGVTDEEAPLTEVREGLA